MLIIDVISSIRSNNHSNSARGRFQGGWLTPSPRNVHLTRKNATRINVNKYLMCFVMFIFDIPPPEKKILL